jgi:hypothetical protein
MLLRVVAAAGAGALVGACSSQSPAVHGLILPADDGGEDGQVTACGGHVCGSIAQPGGSVALPPDSGTDAGEDAPVTACGGHVCGSIALTDAGSDADAGLPCGTGVCGTIISPEAGDQ